MNAVFSIGPVRSLPLFKRAVEIDPQFAIAHAALAVEYSYIGESVLSAESATKAYQLRQRANDHERFFITATYEGQVTGDLEEARAILKLWTQTYPRDVNAHGLLSAFACQGTGNYDESMEAAKRAIQLDADFAPGYLNLAWALLYVNRLDEADQVAQQAAARKVDAPDVLLIPYFIAVLRGDTARMERQVALAKGKPGTEDWVSHSQALVAARAGEIKRPRMMSRHAVDLAREAEQRERAAIYQAGAAVYEALVGNVDQARQIANQALELSKGRDAEYAAGLTFALVKDIRRSQILADDLERRFPKDTSVRFSYLPTLRGLFSLNAREPAKAIDQLQTGPYEFAVPAIGFVAFFGSLYPAYVRGEAYLAAHQGAQAAAEFQKILDHRGIVLGDPVGALAELQIARAFVMSGDLVRAKGAYQDFFAAWKNADPDLPILREAKDEFAKVR